MCRVHFVGINGVGINALAAFFSDMGFEVSGSDSRLGELARGLKSAEVYEGERRDLVSSASLVVHTAAAKEDHFELALARRLGIPVLTRSLALGAVDALFCNGIAIAGTHGKTTTTAMVAHILARADIKTVAMIGGESVEFSNYVNMAGGLDFSEEERRQFLKYCASTAKAGARIALPASLSHVRRRLKDVRFVTEACEYKRSFLSLRPRVGVVTNVECDHPDCYKDIEETKAAFEEFLRGCKMGVTFCEDEGGAQATLFRASEAGKDVAREISGVPLARKKLRLDGDIICDGENTYRLRLEDGGEYNMHNALLATAAASLAGVDVGVCVNALADFRGVKRRFEKVKSSLGVPTYFDFAHHPTEISCVLKRAAEMGRALVVFQPHTYSRTAAYLDDFVGALARGGGELILLPAYAAREKKDAGVDSDALAAAIGKKYPKKRVTLTTSFDEALLAVKSRVTGHDLVIFVGAGDIYCLKDRLK